MTALLETEQLAHWFGNREGVEMIQICMSLLDTMSIQMGCAYLSDLRVFWMVLSVGYWQESWNVYRPGPL